MIKSGAISLNSDFLTRQSNDFNWWQCTAPCISVPEPISVTTVPTERTLVAAPCEIGHIIARLLLLKFAGCYFIHCT